MMTDFYEGTEGQEAVKVGHEEAQFCIEIHKFYSQMHLQSWEGISILL